MADGIVLAKNATQVAVGEENSSGSSGSRDRRLLAVMEVIAGDFGEF